MTWQLGHMSLWHDADMRRQIETGRREQEGKWGNQRREVSPCPSTRHNGRLAQSLSFHLSLCLSVSPVRRVSASVVHPRDHEGMGVGLNREASLAKSGYERYPGPKTE